jgi:hypothetical protein
MFNTLIIDVYIGFSLTAIGLFVILFNTLIIDVYIGFSLTSIGLL